MAVPDFPHIFATYFYRGEFVELLFCHIVNVVDKGLRVTTMDDIFEADKQKALYRGLSLHELSMIHFRLLHQWNTQMNLNNAISNSMRPTSKCELCGKTFVPRSGMQKYCSEECQAEAKRLRKKRQQDLITSIEPIVDLQHQEYLTFSKAAFLMGCTQQYIYKLVANGKLKASRLSNRMAFVRKSDTEKMFEGNPYKRVIPASKSKPCKKAKTEKPTQKQESTKGKEENEVLDKFIKEGHEALSSFAKTDRVNFNEKESASIYYGIMASAVKHNIGLDSKASIESAAKSFLSGMSWKGFTDFKQECITSWTKLFATNEVQFTDKAIDNFLAFVDHMSCSADTYVSLGGSNGCADQLTNWDGTQKVGLGSILQKKGKRISL